MTDLEKLKHFMAPYYQDAADETLLNAYLVDYIYAECAASALWYELAGKAALNVKGLQAIDTGAEKFKYSEPGTIQLACQKQGDYYSKLCDNKKGIGSCAIKVQKATVAGIIDVS